jgi:hypothetical protein
MTNLQQATLPSFNLRQSGYDFRKPRRKQIAVVVVDRQFLGTGYAKSAHNDIFGSIRR